MSGFEPGVVPGVDPALDHGVPAEVLWVDVQDASSGHCGRGRRLQMRDLEHQPATTIQLTVRRSTVRFLPTSTFSTTHCCQQKHFY